MPETEKAPSKEALEAAVKLMRDVFSWEDAMLLTAPGRGAVGSVAAAMEAFAAEQNVDLQVWVNDLQSGLYVNCVYCGHCYGPRETTPVSMADALKAHVEQCPKHPMSALRERNRALVAALRDIADGPMWFFPMAATVAADALAADAKAGEDR